MMSNIIVRYCDLPYTIKGFVVRQFDNDEFFTVILNSRLSFEQLQRTYLHELKHITLGDFDSNMGVDQIERIRHGS